MRVLISIETIDRSDGHNRIVGYAYFPLFLDGHTLTPCNDRNCANLILQSGCYQIPIYMNKVPVDRDITVENI